MNRRYFYITNWKMYWAFDETTDFVIKHFDDLIALSKQPLISIIMCPSAPAIYPLATIFKDTPLAIGAQDCSDQHKGAFTGQISASHLGSAGAQYCIIGHSERRRFNHETNQDIANKCIQLITADLSPIICIGESQEENTQGKTLLILEAQLAPIVQALNQQQAHMDNKTLLIAYEPVWAIGSGQVPTTNHLETVFAWISSYLSKHLPSPTPFLIYGGSVTSNNLDLFKDNKHINGFLIGGASLDFQELEKIVKYRIKAR